MIVVVEMTAMVEMTTIGYRSFLDDGQTRRFHLRLLVDESGRLGARTSSGPGDAVAGPDDGPREDCEADGGEGDFPGAEGPSLAIVLGDEDPVVILADAPVLFDVDVLGYGFVLFRSRPGNHD